MRNNASDELRLRSIQSLENDRRILLEFITRQYSHAIPTRFQNVPLESINVLDLVDSLKTVLSPSNSMSNISPPKLQHEQSNNNSNNGQLSVSSGLTPPAFNSSLIPSPASTCSSGTTNGFSGTSMPENYGILTKEQLHLSSYETYLLISRFGRPSNESLNMEEEDSFRIQMEISKIKHETFIKMFTPPISGPHPLFHSVTYRLWVMRHMDFKKFDTFDAMMMWWRRQLYVVMAALTNMVCDPFTDPKAPLPSVIMTLKQQAFNLEQLMVDMNSQNSGAAGTHYSQFMRQQEYARIFSQLDQFIGTAILVRSPPKGGSKITAQTLATEYLHEPIPYQFPLNTNMFEDLLFYNLFEFNNNEIIFVGSESLQTPSNLRPLSLALRISETMSKICHLNCFLTSYQAESREDHFGRLKIALDKIETIISTNIVAIQDTTFSTLNLLKLTLKKMAQWLLKILSDVHSHKSENITKDIELACSIYVQSREIWNMISSTKSIKTTESNFTSFITSSISCHYSRLSKPFRPLTLDNFSEFVELLTPEIKLNLNTYTKGFQRYHENAMSVALNEFLNLYTMDVKIVFADVYFLSPMVIQSVQAASQFQIFLQDLKLIPLEKLPPIADYVSNVISSWCQTQEKAFNKWFENMFQVDKFQPMGKDIKHSSSVIDMFQMFYQTISTLSKMKGSLGNHFYGFISTLSNMFNKHLIIYNQTIAEITMQTQKQYLFPLSQNERIQKKGAFRKSVSNLAASSGGIGSSSSSSTSGSSNALSQHTSKEYSIPPAIQGKILNQNLLTLIVCLNNLDFITTNIGDYVEHHSYNNMDLKKSLSDLFEPTMNAFRNSSNQLIDYIGAKVVFIDLKESFIESAYLNPLNQKTRVDSALESLEKHLKTIYTNISNVQRGNQVLSSVCKAFLQGVEYIVLYGGPQRVFNPKDVELLELDIESIKDFFADRDEQGNANGVQDSIFDSYCQPLLRVFHLLMDQSSEILIEQFNSGKAAGFGREVVMAVLVHRNDKPARTFIKKKLSDQYYLQIKKNSKIKFLVN